MKTLKDIQDETATEINAAEAARFTKETATLPQVQRFFEIRGLWNRNQIGHQMMIDAFRAAIDAGGVPIK